ncbi:MAG: hypothetical protein J0M07_21005 [Anaerolineae bacterium]|nr:hypothetical protein [Anaerolineae bacterium]
MKFSTFLLVVAWALIGGRLPVTALQPVTPQPPLLRAGDPVTGTLSADDAPVNYRVALPPGADVIFELNAPGVLTATICRGWQTANGAAESECQPHGASGDGPVTLLHLVSSTSTPNQTEWADITFARPIDSSVDYRLTAYQTMPQELDLDSVYAPEELVAPYQTYSVRVADFVPFSVQIEDLTTDGDFLWTAHLPSRLLDVERSAVAHLPELIDWASFGLADANRVGLQRMLLYYLGAETYRILVHTTTPYQLHTTYLSSAPLAAGETRVATPSYQQPIVLIPLALNAAEAAQVDFRLVTGSGAVATVQRASDPIGESVLLGNGGRDVIWPSEQSLEVLFSGDTAAYVFVQIPLEFTRSTIEVEVRWSALQN